MLYGRHPWGQFMVNSLWSNQFTAEEATTTTIVCQSGGEGSLGLRQEKFVGNQELEFRASVEEYMSKKDRFFALSTTSLRSWCTGQRITSTYNTRVEIKCS